MRGNKTKRVGETEGELEIEKKKCLEIKNMIMNFFFF